TNEGRFEKVEGSEFELPCELVLLAMGFTGPERGSWLDRLGVSFDARGNVVRDASFMTEVPGVFVAGDMGRGRRSLADRRVGPAGADRADHATARLTAPLRRRLASLEQSVLAPVDGA